MLDPRTACTSYGLVRWPVVDSPGLGRPSEKRKVGGSTPPLTTTSDQRKRCSCSLRPYCLAMGLLMRVADCLGEDVSDSRRVLAENVGVDAQCHGRVGVTEASRDDVDRDARQQERGRV